MTIQAEDGPANDIDTGTTASGRLHDAADSVRGAAGAAKNAAGDAYASARDKVGDVFGTVKDKSGAAYGAAVGRAGDTFDTARDKAADAYDAARDKAADAYDAARDRAAAASRAAADGIEGNPIAALAGGIALGVLVGALLPRTQREADLLGPLASRLSDGVRAAASAAREAGQEKLDELGLNRAAAKDTVSKLMDTAVKAATSAGTAAADTVRQS